MINSQAEELSQGIPEEFPEETCDFHPLPPKREAALRAVLSHPTLCAAAASAVLA